MKKTWYINYCLLAVCIAGLLSIVSCQKEKKQVDDETQSVVDNSICEQEFMQIQPNVNNMAINTKGTGAKKGAATSCDTLKFLGGDTNYVAQNYTLYEFDYGACSQGVFDNYGRSGKVNVKFIGKPKFAGSSAIIKLLNYKVNNAVTYTCDSIVVTTLTVTATTYKFRVQVLNGVCTSVAGWTIKYACDKTITINLNGPGGADDVVMITGNANGVNRQGRSYTVTTNQITKHANCKWISAGTLDLKPDGYDVRTVNYGDADVCDDDATYTVKGQTIAFKLK